MAIEFRRDGPWTLPEGWVWARLGDIATILPGQSPPSHTYNAHGEGLPFFQGKSEFGESSPTARKWCSLPRRIAEPGDILISVRAPVGPTNLANLQCAIGRGLAAIRPRSGIESRWLLFVLKRIEHSIAERATGTTFGGIPTTLLGDLIVPVAPIGEQRRIVARIDELFTEIVDGETALARAREDLDTWRRSLLKAAVTGELTREWREHNEPNRTGPQLLESFRSPKQKKDRTRRSQEIEPIELPEIPSNWCWGTVDGLIASMEYGTSEKCDAKNSGLPVLRMGNIQDGEITFDKLKFLLPELAADAPRLEVNDILFNRTNSEELVGKSAVVYSLPQDMSFASYLIRLKVVADVDSTFLVAWINSAFGRKWIRANKSQQVGQANLSGGKLKSMPIPVPPAMEQAEIAGRLQEAAAWGKDQQSDIETARSATFAVRQSMLKAAFEGRLVEQDAREEPADRLLARLNDKFDAATTAQRKTRARRAALAAE